MFNVPMVSANSRIPLFQIRRINSIKAGPVRRKYRVWLHDYEEEFIDIIHWGAFDAVLRAKQIAAEKTGEKYLLKNVERRE